MKRLKYSGYELITSSAVATAVMEYSTYVVRSGTSVAVDIPVLETDGAVRTHTLLIGPATQFDASDVDERDGDQEARFEVPRFPPIGGKAAPNPPGEIDAHAFAVEDLPLD